MALTRLAGVLAEHRELEALAWVDADTGVIVEGAYRNETSAAALDLAAGATPALCVGPAAEEGEPAEAPRDVLVISPRGVQAVIPPRTPAGLALLGVARPDVNVALLLAELGRLAGACGT